MVLMKKMTKKTIYFKDDGQKMKAEKCSNILDPLEYGSSTIIENSQTPLMRTGRSNSKNSSKWKAAKPLHLRLFSLPVFSHVFNKSTYLWLYLTINWYLELLIKYYSLHLSFIYVKNCNFFWKKNCNHVF